jgi:2-methylcitrate dehydratase PrpD
MPFGWFLFLIVHLSGEHMELTRRNFMQISALLAGSVAAGQAWSLADTDAPAAQDAIGALVDFCLKTRYEDLPPEVVHITRTQIMDTIGIMLPSRDQDGVRQLRELTQEEGGKPESRIFGTNSRVPLENAARLNASMGHALEFDDTYEKSLMHTSVVTIPVALTVSDMVGGVSGKELIATVASATEVACRLSRVGSPGVSPFIVGWDPTPLYGYIVSSMVVSRLLKLTREQAIAATGLAYHQMGGNAQGSIEGTLAKRMGPGFATYGGVISARLAQRGVFGPTHVLEGIKGLFKQYHGGKYSRDDLLGGLGKTYAAPDITPKPYPCCRGGHNAIDATLELVKASNIKPADVERITIYNPPAEFMLLDSPVEKKQKPATIIEAQFSNPWMVAAALQDREVGLRHFTPDALKRADLLALTQRIQTVEDKSLFLPGAPGGVRVEIVTKGGKTHTKQLTYAKGDPKNPMTQEEFAKKFMDCTETAGMSRTQATALMQRIQKLEGEADVAAIVTAMVVKG